MKKKYHIYLFLVKNLSIATWSVHFYSYNFVINYFLGNDTNINRFFIWLVVSVLTVIFALFLKLFSNLLTVNIQTNTYKRLQQKIILNLSKQNYSYLTTKRNETISYLKDYTEKSFVILNLFTNNIYEAFGNFVISIIFMFIISYCSWIFIITIFIFEIIFIIIHRLYSPYIKKQINNILEEYKTSTRKDLKHYAVFYIYYFFNKVALFKEIIKNKMSNFNALYFKYNLKTSWADSLANTFTFLSLMIAFTELVFLTYYKNIEIGVFFAFISYITRVTTSFVYVANCKTGFRVYSPILNEILEDVKHNENLEVFNEKISSILLENVSYKYNSESFIFKEKTLEIEANLKYAIIGDSGSGKSTLLKVISGLLLDYQGNILINNQQNLTRINPKSIRKKIGIIDNQNIIFEDTLLNNITLWDENPNLDKVKNLLEEFKIKKLELDTVIDSNSLSEGEKQRIILARIFYADFDIICLDEALDNIEKDFTKQIWEYILNKKDKTIIAISHHFNSKQLEKFDKVITI